MQQRQGPCPWDLQRRCYPAKYAGLEVAGALVGTAIAAMDKCVLERRVLASPRPSAAVPGRTTGAFTKTRIVMTRIRKVVTLVEIELINGFLALSKEKVIFISRKKADRYCRNDQK